MPFEKFVLDLFGTKTAQFVQLEKFFLVKTLPIVKNFKIFMVWHIINVFPFLERIIGKSLSFTPKSLHTNKDFNTKFADSSPSRLPNIKCSTI